MSLVVSKSNPNIRLQRAIRDFEKDLSREQRAGFEAQRAHASRSLPTYQDVMRLTEEIDLASRVLKSGRCFGTRFKNVLDAVQQFAAVGDVIVGGSQNMIACGVWALVRMTLVAVVRYSSCVERFSELLMDIGRSAPRYERMAELCPLAQAQDLRSSVTEYFIVVVQLCHRFLKLTQKSSLSQMMSLLSDADIGLYRSQMEKWSNSIREEVTFLVAQGVQEQNLQIKSLLKSEEDAGKRRRIEAHRRALDWCSTYDYETTWTETRKLGKATWFQQTPEYRNWKTSTQSSTLFCRGKLGSGKSVLLANIVGDLVAEPATGPCTVAFFFCRHDIRESLRADTVIRSLARQLLRPIPDLTMVESDIDMTRPVPDTEAILSAVRRALPLESRAYFVLDGLEECHQVEQHRLGQLLQRLQRAMTLHTCIGSRSDIDSFLFRMPDPFANVTAMAMPDENPDIGQYVENTLYNRIESGRLVLGDPFLVLEIRDAVLAGAQGMFLWVALQLESLCTASTDEDIRKSLCNLPKSLPETYSRIMARSRELPFGEKYQIRLFELVLTAYRPLQLEQLREALSVTAGDDTWDPSRLLNDIVSVIACCGSLVTIDEENLTVRLVHHSVKQFLAGNGHDGHVIMPSARNSMRDIVLTYLNYGIFDTEISTRVVPKLLLKDTPDRIIRSLGPRSRSRDLALMLVRSKSRHGVDMTSIVTEANKRPPSTTSNQFPFRLYAQDHWLDHATGMTKMDEGHSIAYHMLCKVVGRKLTLNKNIGEESRRILFWAANNGEHTTLELCLDSEVDVNSKHSELRTTPLFFAATGGHRSCVDLLLRRGADLSFQDAHGRTALSWAAGYGHAHVVQLLVDKGAEVDKLDDRNWTPLMVASDAGREKVVRILLLSGADPLVKANRARPADPVLDLLPDRIDTPVALAIRQGFSRIVQVFLDSGVDPNLQISAADEHHISIGSIRLMDIAAMYDQGSVIEALVDYGAATVWEAPGINGAAEHRDMLAYAAKHNCPSALQALIAKGAKIDSAYMYPSDITPLIAAAKEGFVGILSLLIDAGADLEKKDSHGLTALWHAARNFHTDALRMLIEHGAEREVKQMNVPCQTVLCNAAYTTSFYDENAVPRIKLLIEHGFDVEAEDIWGRTPLILAVDTKTPREDVVECLLAAGAKLVTRQGRSALDAAERNGHENIVCLIERFKHQESVGRRTPSVALTEEEHATPGTCSRTDSGQ